MSHLNVSFIVWAKSSEQCLLNFIQQFDQSCCYLLCEDFNARTGNLNALSHDSNEDTITFVQTELCEYRQSEDKTVNTFGRLLLEMCAECDLRILNGVCRGDEKRQFLSLIHI